jgi:antitoxin YefM
MPIITATKARAKLYQLINEAVLSHEPIIITSKRGNAVLISEDDWRAIQETLYLLSIPGMRESIKVGLATPIEDCSEEPGWSFLKKFDKMISFFFSFFYLSTFFFYTFI